MPILVPLLQHPNSWAYLVNEMLYRVYVVAWEFAEENAKYMNLSRATSVVADSSRNPDYVAGGSTSTSR